MRLAALAGEPIVRAFKPRLARLAAEGRRRMLIRPEIENLPRYKPLIQAKKQTLGPDGRPLARMNANEGPWPPFPEAIEVMERGLAESNWYPDQSYADLKLALGEVHGVDPALISVGSGSANLIRLLTLVLLSPGDEVLLPWPPYPAHGLAVGLMGAVVVKVPLRDGAPDLDAALALVTPATKLVMLCSPHNPTGSVIRRATFETFIERLPEGVVTVLDQAYQEFVTDPEAVDGRAYVTGSKPVVVFRTFSKVYGLAGARSGYSFASEVIATAMERARETFSISQLAAAASVASIRRQDIVQERVQLNAIEREKLLEACDGYRLLTTPSEANFVWIDVRRNGKAVADALLRRGFMVRSGEVHDAPNHIRVTCGRPDENDGFIRALGEVLEEIPEELAAT
jgi:histidinol-phosphate aminotransferase